jgi:DNA-binding GntR family transcriptional regulator
VSSKVLKEQAYHQIRKQILNLEIQPNQRIVEQDLAEQLNISRTPIREAINQLVSEGLVRMVPRKGCYCIFINQTQKNQIIDIRLALEVLAIKTCFQIGLTREQLNALIELTERYQECVITKNYTNIHELDGEFHHTIALYTQNQFLVKYLNDLEGFLTIIRNTSCGVGSIEKALSHHKAIVNAFVIHDEAQAIAAMTSNINNMRDRPL